MSFLNKNTPAPTREGHPLQNKGQRLIRMLMLVGVFAVVSVSFAINSERNFQKIVTETAMRVDYTGELSPEEENRLSLYQEKFFRAYGVKIQIRVENREFDEESAKQAGVVFLGLNPVGKKSSFYAPPLVAAALGPELTHSLREDFFLPYFEKNEWPQGLAAALESITLKLDESLKR